MIDDSDGNAYPVPLSHRSTEARPFFLVGGALQLYPAGWGTRVLKEKLGQEAGKCILPYEIIDLMIYEQHNTAKG